MHELWSLPWRVSWVVRRGGHRLLCGNFVMVPWERQRGFLKVLTGATAEVSLLWYDCYLARAKEWEKWDELGLLSPFRKGTLRHPEEGIWVAFCLLSEASSLYRQKWESRDFLSIHLISKSFVALLGIVFSLFFKHILESSITIVAKRGLFA